MISTTPAPGRPTVAMPAGDAKREQERKNTDALAAEAEHYPLQAIEPDALTIHREIASRLVDDQLQPRGVEHAQEGYVYCRVAGFNHLGQTDTSAVIAKQRLMIRDAETGQPRPVWELVRGSDPEDPHLKDLNGGIRKLGDTVLMRARKAEAVAIELRETETRLARDHGASVNLLQMAEQYPGILQLHSFQQSPTEYLRDRASAARRGLARQLAQKQVDSRIRQGTLFGRE